MTDLPVSALLRKTEFIVQTIHSEMGRPVSRPIVRVAAVAVLRNPFAGAYVQDLSVLSDLGMSLGEELMPRAVAMLGGSPVAYGKAAIVGVNGDIEHAAAILHPKLGKPMRAAVGGGEAIIPSTAKVAACGAGIDVPLGNKDNVWSFNELDTLTLTVADAPRPDEIVLIMAVSTAGRPDPRVGAGRALV